MSKTTTLADGQSVEMKGSAKQPYVLKNTAGVYSCTCPAWRNQSVAIDRRTCKHLRKLLGDAAETARIGAPLPEAVVEKVATVTPPPLLLAQNWDRVQDLTGWWVSEKLDGVRAFWDGKQFLSRLGNKFYAPDWFTEDFPHFPVDGELWMGRKQFQRTVSIVRKQIPTDDWKQIEYMVFDAPFIDGDFETRIGALYTYEHNAQIPYLSVVTHTECNGADDVEVDLAFVESLGGEGLMFREPHSFYEAGRSSTLLKVKNFLDDEAVVVGHGPGKGRHKGRLGQLVVQLPNGIQFELGTGLSDAERESPPAIGTVVNFRYQELSDGGVPRFPSYVGIRGD